MSMHLISLKYVNNIQNKIKKGRVIVGIRKRERDREREREFPITVSFPNVQNTQYWARTKPGARS